MEQLIDHSPLGARRNHQGICRVAHILCPAPSGAVQGTRNLDGREMVPCKIVLVMQGRMVKTSNRRCKGVMLMKFVLHV
jgi:hypothetical protein